MTTRAVATPKLVLTDSGLAAHLTGMSLRHAGEPTAPVGPLIETFVLGELTRQLTLTDQPVRLYHYRDRDQYEVDAVIESASGEVIACEVKAAETVRSEDFPRHPATSPPPRRPARGRHRALRWRPAAPVRRPAPRMAHLDPVDPRS
jgi:predicted AAA+ superfamily ATPase